MSIKISVLMTVYNEEIYVEKAIESVLNQTFKDFEFIIIDDGSIDNTKKVINSFKDERIKYYYAGKNKGYTNLEKAANFGLKKCRGKYIARIDADDICYPNRLKTQYKYLERNRNIFMVGGACDIIDEKGRIIGEVKKRSYPSFLYRYRLVDSNPFIHSSIMFRNEGFMYPSFEDFYFYTNLARFGKRMKNISQKLVKYRINPHGVVSRHTKNPRKTSKYYFNK